jgi:hypothetical protein
MPSLMPSEVGRAIDVLLAFRSVTAVELYDAIREALPNLSQEGPECAERCPE